MFTVERFFSNWRNLIIHESSPNNRGPSIRFKNEVSNYIPTQFFPSSKTGEIINGFRNENLEELTFPDQSIDLHITQDVFEHIIDPSLAFREIARTLKPGGAHIFTTPLVRIKEPTNWCVRRNIDGKIEQLVHPKEFHGNPISNEGSLVTVQWGYDITSFIYSCCNLFTEMVYID
jgi:SAM-dependent methyltransferase